jgi:hypothetical protein
MWRGHSCPATREAAKDFSLRRQPWAEMANTQSPGRAKENSAGLYFCNSSATSQSIAASRVLNIGNLRCEKLLMFS